MDTSVLENEFLLAQEAVGKQGDVVRSLKAQLKDGKVERVRRGSMALSVRVIFLNGLHAIMCPPYAEPLIPADRRGRGH